MSTTLSLSLTANDWLALFSHFLMLSLLAVGGAISVLPDMHRYLVTQLGWLDEAQLSAAIAIGQAAPGPNVLAIALMGWQVGLNTGSHWGALGGMLLTMTGFMLPSSLLTYITAHWMHVNRQRRTVRALRQGLMPLVVALLLATAWLLSASHDAPARDWPLWLLTLAALLLVWRTRLHMLWLLAAGAAVGWMGWLGP